jgi:hypothetical protein
MNTNRFAAAGVAVEADGVEPVGSEHPLITARRQVMSNGGWISFMATTPGKLVCK